MTLWLTRIHPDRRTRDAHRDLADATRLHKRVMSLVPDGLGEQARQQAGVLFRLDQARNGPQLLVQSCLQPDVTKLPTGYGTVETRDLTLLLAALDKGTLVHYRLAANASKRLGRNADRPGKVVALTGQAADMWWAQRAERIGLNLRSITSTPQADAVGYRDDDSRVKHAITRFDGLAVVTDPEAVRAAVRAGIGRGKSHGCGLLSLAPARG